MLSCPTATQNTHKNRGAAPFGPPTTPRAGPGSAAAQTGPYRARHPAQGNPPAGTYSDTVRVILTY
ncbi:hypothetical protein CDO43_37775 [Pseudomonas aeruginosa]|nr:hypothetical protein CDO43_37775 [Pseudomonas aeruginosa]